MSATADVLDLHSLLPGEVSSSLCRLSAGEAAADAALAALAGPWHLAVLDGPDRGLVIAVRDGAVLGRGEVLSDPLVSRRHLRLRLHGSRVLAQDCGSANGSYRYWHLGLWLRARREMRLREGALLRLGDSVLELRRRPSDLVVATPAAPASSTAWLMVGSLVCVLVMAGSAAIALRTGSRGAVGMVMVAPMVAMTIMRLVPFLQQRRARRTGRAGGPRWRGHRRRRGRRPGWRHGEPDPATMLLAVAARSSMSQSAQDSPAEGSTPVSATQETLAAWSAGHRRRCVLSLSDGESLALVGTGAGSALRWWCAQLLARDEVRVTVLDDSPDEHAGHRGGVDRESREEAGDRLGLRLTWGPQAHPRSAQIVTCSHNGVPPQALSTRPAPAGAPSCSPIWWEAVRHLSRSRITSPHRESSQGDGVPDLVPLSAVMDDLDAHELRARWEERTHSPARGAPALSAVLGVGARGPVRADLVTDGPHALLAGTTGSGKSELLISWLVQLALSRAPDRLTLVLVDYKGGAAFGPLAGLPHTAGVLTDLDPAGTQRALSSLEAEVHRRERILAAHGAKDVTCLPPRVVIPDLVVAVDEFATLAGEHAEVLESLVRIAAQGRSLGIHLILATQRPQGAVSPAIRANTSLRVCLRVLDAADSRDVLGHDGAARLGHHPGRVLVSGAGGVEDGGPAPRDPDNGASGSPSPGSQVLQAPWCGSAREVQEIVGLISRAAEEHSAPWRPWAPALPASISAAEALELVRLRGPRAPGELEEQGAPVPTDPADHPPLSGHDDDRLLLAVTDLPRQQSLGVWQWRVTRPLLVLGAPRSGRSTLVASAATAALGSGRGVHLCGFAPPAPDASHAATHAASPVRRLLAHPEVGTVVGTEDPRRLARLWGLAASGRLGADLLCLDNVDALIPTIDEVLGPGQGNALLEAVIRTTSATGAPLLLTAPLVASTARWAGSMGLRLVLGAVTGTQAALAGLPRGVVTGGAPGRGVILDGATTTACQIVLREDCPVSGSERDGGCALRLEPLPTRLTWEDVPQGTWAVGGDAAAPVTLPARTSVLVAGPPGSGRSTALRALAQAKASDALVVDDLDLADIATVTQVEAALAGSEVVLASASTEKVATTFRGAISSMREREALVVLWPGMRPADQAAGVSLRTVTDPRAMTLPGRGALVYRGTCLPIQIVLPRPEDDDHPIEYPV
ncbi:cell division protein FtsK [Actinomyces oris]|uniref:Cell division protein FtsK n=1 Tax=Actinomyces oris TaxID=544580 RepID=A0A1Q8VG67_9ACTO|nr:FtsK/SpoIIIE domain-containing protein [Actinomyces oris]OLO47106.1 cell division protein FtsK [Actinomyces oris]